MLRSVLSEFFALPHQLPLEYIQPIQPLSFQRPTASRRPSALAFPTNSEDAQPLLQSADDSALVDGFGTARKDVAPGDAEDLIRRAEALGDGVRETSLGGKGFDDLTLYEKKSVLVNRELDLMGMGHYQHLIFLLCGLGYFLDLLYAQVFSLVAGPIRAEMGVKEADIGWLYASFNAGLMAGAMGWGMAVDVIGRRWCFNLTCLISTVFGFLFALPSSFPSLCVLSAGVGIGVGGNIPIDATIVLEFLPKNRRYLLAALSTFQPLGTVAASLIAWAIIPGWSCPQTSGSPCPKADNMGWRYTILTIAFITAFIFLARFAVFKFRESPKFLLSTGHDAHALDVLYAIAVFNGTPLPALSLEDFQALEYVEWRKDVKVRDVEQQMEAEPKTTRGWKSKLGGLEKYVGHLGGMFRSRVYAYLFVVLAIAYMSLFFSFSIAGGFLPLILAARGVEMEMSQSQTYRSYLSIYLPGVTATWAAAYAMDLPKIGRKWAMVFAAGLMGASLFLYQLVNSIPANIAFNALEYWCQSLYSALLYAYTPEAFPATYRGSASGMLSTLGRVAGIVAPVVAGRVYTGGDSPGVLYLAGGAAWMSMLAIACLPFDTRGKEAY